MPEVREFIRDEKPRTHTTPRARALLKAVRLYFCVRYLSQLRLILYCTRRVRGYEYELWLNASEYSRLSVVTATLSNSDDSNSDVTVTVTGTFLVSLRSGTERLLGYIRVER